ncbi:MAG TPA: sigma-70 family RNA polymerase sigma factor [Phycisphaerales bacterium]|nr:sigma-70 family RNA polymerase sigma factor [Phycisphaerales bacterium]
MADAPIERLVELIAQGNRDAAAVLVTKYEPMIRRRIRARLGGETRRLFDSQDVFSTVCRRFDRFVDGRRVRAATPGDLLSLLSRIAQTSVLDKQRMVTRLDRLEGEDSEFATLVRRRVDREWADPTAFEVDVKRWASLLDSPQDRTILFRHLAGRSFEQVARELGISPELARKRWQLIRARLRKELTSGSSE